jgi:hypothetical protein
MPALAASAQPRIAYPYLFAAVQPDASLEPRRDLQFRESTRSGPGGCGRRRRAARHGLRSGLRSRRAGHFEKGAGGLETVVISLARPVRPERD